MHFRFTDTAIDTQTARREVTDPGAGGYVSFEGWVRDHNEGQAVTHLEYEAFQALAVKEGASIMAEARSRFPIRQALCIHRLGCLDLTDLAVWVGVSAAHRGEAFAACRFIIDEVKHRLPIWKKEHYQNGNSGWVNCERCAAAAQPAAPHDSAQDARIVHRQYHAQADSLGALNDHSPAHRTDNALVPARHDPHDHGDEQGDSRSALPTTE